MLAHTAAGFLIDVGKVGWEKTQTVCLQSSRCEAKSLTPTPLSMPKGVTANHTSAASFRRFPISVPAACAVRAADRHHRGRLLLVTSLGEAREVTRLPGRNPAWSSGRTSVLLHPPAGLSCEAAVATAARVHSAKARRRCDASLAGEAMPSSLPWGVAGCSSRRPTRFFAPPKKWGKKGGPYDGGQRYALTARAARD